MIYSNVTGFRKDMFKFLEHTIVFNEPLNISTKDGNAIVLSEEDYIGMIETMNLSSIPDVRDAIIKGLDTSLSDCIPESEIDW